MESASLWVLGFTACLKMIFQYLVLTQITRNKTSHQTSIGEKQGKHIIWVCSSGVARIVFVLSFLWRLVFFSVVFWDVDGSQGPFCNLEEIKNVWEIARMWDCREGLETVRWDAVKDGKIAEWECWKKNGGAGEAGGVSQWLRLWFGMLGRHGHGLPLLWKLQNRKNVGHGRTRRRDVWENGGSLTGAERKNNVVIDICVESVKFCHYRWPLRDRLWFWVSTRTDLWHNVCSIWLQDVMGKKVNQDYKLYPLSSWSYYKRPLSGCRSGVRDADIGPHFWIYRGVQETRYGGTMNLLNILTYLKHLEWENTVCTISHEFVRSQSWVLELYNKSWICILQCNCIS